MSKELCKLKKSLLKEDIGSFMELINQPTHICTKCGRAANSKKLLCEPTKIYTSSKSEALSR
jgi:hypothetical protein